MDKIAAIQDNIHFCPVDGAVPGATRKDLWLSKGALKPLAFHSCMGI